MYSPIGTIRLNRTIRFSRMPTALKASLSGNQVLLIEQNGQGDCLSLPVVNTLLWINSRDICSVSMARESPNLMDDLQDFDDDGVSRSLFGEVLASQRNFPHQRSGRIDRSDWGTSFNDLDSGYWEAHLGGPDCD